MPRPCTVCGSRRWRRTGGVVTCEEGHVLQGFRQEENTITDPSRHQMIQRRLKKAKRRKRRREVGEKDPEVYEGEAKLYLKLEMLQLMLRHQLVAVQKAWGISKEIEIIARDLWILTLETYPTPLPPIPRNDEDQEPEAGPSKSKPSYPSGSASQPLPSKHDEPVKKLRAKIVPGPGKRLGRPKGAKDSQPRRMKRANGTEAPVEDVQDKPKIIKKRKRVQIQAPDKQKDENEDVDMDASSEGPMDDSDATIEEDDAWDGDESEKGEETYAYRDEKDYDEDEREMDKDEYEYDEEDEGLDSDILERLSADDSDSLSSTSSNESELPENQYKVYLANGGYRIADRTKPGKFLSASGYAYGTRKDTASMKWRFGARPAASAIKADTVLQILLLSLWTMRVPVMMMDVIRAVEDGTIPYIEFGRSKFIPEAIRPHLSRDMMSGGTWAKRAPSASVQLKSLVNFVDDLGYRHGVRIPEVNSAPILWRLVCLFGGSPVIYITAYYILQTSKMSLTISRPAHYVRHEQGEKASNKEEERSRTPEEQDGVTTDTEGFVTETDGFTTENESGHREKVGAKRWRGPKRRDGMANLVEVRLLGAVIVAFKLIYGLDEIERVPVSPSDLSIGLPTAQAWTAEVRKKVESGWFKAGSVELQPIDFLRSRDEDVEDFLARAEQLLLSSRTLLPAMESAAAMFPLEAHPNYSRLQGETARAIRGWQPFLSTCARIQAPVLGEYPTGPTMPIGARILQYIKSKRLVRSLDQICMPTSLEPIVMAAVHVTGVTQYDIIAQISAIENWLRRPPKGGLEQEKSAPVNAFQIHRDRLRTAVEAIDWTEDGNDSDLQSYHSGSGEETDSDGSHD